MILSRNSRTRAAALLSPLALASFALATEGTTVGELTRHTHIHGLAVDRHDPARLLIATHHGLFSAGPDGKAQRISEVQDFMGFNAHPFDSAKLYASGHPPRGGNLGFIASYDRGKTWTQISPGVNGPVDFHQMTVSPADPNTIYGVYRGLQASRDGGRTWTVGGPAPDRLIGLAASTRNADTLYAATETGLLISTDAGKSWKSLLQGSPVTLVEVTPGGILYAFVVGRGLVGSAEEPLNITTLGNDFGGGFLQHLAVDPVNPSRLFAATGRGRLLASSDAGQTWVTFGGSVREGRSP
jgi:photosystem II stability/assembly factor-like uncharacterized protein